MVLVADNQERVSIRPVEYDIMENGWIGITDGLNSEDKVIISGQVALHEGDHIRIKND